MLEQDEYKVTDQGDGFTVGELTRSSKKLGYLKAGTLVGYFDGVDNALSYVQTHMAEAKHEKSSENKGKRDFNAFETYEEAITTFRNAPEKVTHFDPSELRIKDESESGTTVEYEVIGDYIDMGRYMEGVPETWGSMHGGNARNRRANIIINLNQLWSLTHEDIQHRAERILRLVDALEAGGIRTMLTGILSNQCGHYEFTLKRHEEPLTISDLAVVTHPEFLRRIGFRLHEYSKTWDYGYGSAVAFSDALKPELVKSENNDEMNIIVDSNMRGKMGIDQRFDQLERLLVWEMSKPVPEVDAIKVDARGIYFNANGSRAEAEIRAEGQEAINAAA
jgi:hypothetical protein